MLTLCSRIARYANTLLTSLNNRVLIKHRKKWSTTRPSQTDREVHTIDVYAQGTGDESRASAQFTSVIGMVDLGSLTTVDVFDKNRQRSDSETAIEFGSSGCP